MTLIQIILCSIFGLVALFYINGHIYLHTKRGWMKWLYHDICKWHVPDEYETRRLEGGIYLSKCRHCHRDIWKSVYGGTDWIPD